MKKKRVLVSVWSALTALVLLTACSGGTQSANQVACTVSIACPTAVAAGNETAKQVADADGMILKETEIKVEEGQTVLDALKKCDVSVVTQGSGTSAYVTAISSVASGDSGSMSGWMFKVNGEVGMKGCAEQTVAEGDKIEWVYTVDGGPDVGVTYE